MATQKLLLVDDDPTDRHVVLAAIAEVGPVQVIVKEDGRAALAYLRSFDAHAYDAPSVVFLDLSMPDMSGFDVLRELKLHAAACRIPVVVFTASEREADLYLGYHLGANAYVIKPADPDQFRKTVVRTASFWLNSVVRPRG